jgi:hypothetical protein
MSSLSPLILQLHDLIPFSTILYNCILSSIESTLGAPCTTKKRRPALLALLLALNRKRPVQYPQRQYNSHNSYLCSSAQSSHGSRRRQSSRQHRQNPRRPSRDHCLQRLGKQPKGSRISNQYEEYCDAMGVGSPVRVRAPRHERHRWGLPFFLKIARTKSSQRPTIDDSTVH